MKHLILVFIALLSLTHFTYAQKSGYRAGYVIKTNKDTIHGYLKNYNEALSCARIKMIDENNQKIKIKKKTIHGYKIGSKTYIKKPYKRPLSLSNMQGYMRIVSLGKVNLYIFNYTVRNSGGFVAGANGSFTPNPIGGFSSSRHDYYLEKNDTLTLVRTLGFKKKMANYFSKDTSLSEQIKNKELRYNDILEIVEIYNASTL